MWIIVALRSFIIIFFFFITALILLEDFTPQAIWQVFEIFMEFYNAILLLAFLFDWLTQTLLFFWGIPFHDYLYHQYWKLYSFLLSILTSFSFTPNLELESLSGIFLIIFSEEISYFSTPIDACYFTLLILFSFLAFFYVILVSIEFFSSFILFLFAIFPLRRFF